MDIVHTLCAAQKYGKEKEHECNSDQRKSEQPRMYLYCTGRGVQNAAAGSIDTEIIHVGNKAIRG